MPECSAVGKIIQFPPIHPCYRKGWFVRMMERIKKKDEIEMNKDGLAKLQKCIEHLAKGGVLQNVVGGRWEDVDYTKTINFNTEWMISHNCRIKPTPKTIPLSLETWPQGLVQVKHTSSGLLYIVAVVSSDGVYVGAGGGPVSFDILATHYTHPDGRPLTIEVEG